MRVDPRGVVFALRRAVKEGNRGMADLLTDQIAQSLERLDAIDEAARAAQEERAPVTGQEEARAHVVSLHHFQLLVCWCGDIHFPGEETDA